MAPAFRIRAPETPDEYRACYRLRWELLRAPWGQPPGSEQDAFESRAWHRMAITPEGCVIGYGRLHRESEDTGRIRYMAVRPEWQGQGVGTALLAALESAARAARLRRIRLQARTSAVGFYLRHGYRDLGAGPLLFGVIAHRKMEKVVSGEEVRREA
ncbi:MAG: GNAT family N-acetyltransferase [Gammaproteobacteria bacterium]|nr:MAG: GNAT family N-acetyltransferase [Gammaproteobacteria bacterium]